MCGGIAKSRDIPICVGRNKQIVSMDSMFQIITTMHGRRQDNRDVMTVFEQIDRTSPYDFARALKDISQLRRLPVDFSSYIVRAMDVYQTRILDLTPSPELQTEKGRAVLLNFQLSERWEDVVQAFDNMRPVTAEHRRAVRLQAMEFLQGDGSDMPEQLPDMTNGFSNEEQQDMLSIKRAIRGLFRELVAELNHFDAWKGKAENLRAAMHASIIYDFINAGLRLLQETQAISSVEELFGAIRKLSSTVDQALPPTREDSATSPSQPSESPDNE